MSSLFIVFILGALRVLAQSDVGIDYASDMSLYGVAYNNNLSAWEKMRYIILPVSFVVFIVIAFVVGTMVFIKKKRLNKLRSKNKKDENK